MAVRSTREMPSGKYEATRRPPGGHPNALEMPSRSQAPIRPKYNPLCSRLTFALPCRLTEEAILGNHVKRVCICLFLSYIINVALEDASTSRHAFVLCCIVTTYRPRQSAILYSLVSNLTYKIDRLIILIHLRTSSIPRWLDLGNVSRRQFLGQSH